MRTVTAPGRWIWGLSGVVTLALLAITGSHLITGGGSAGVGPMAMSAVPSRLITVPQPVTSLQVDSYGGNIQVIAAPVLHAQVRESIEYGADMSGPPAVNVTVTRGRLTLDAPACAGADCSVGFTVTVPENVAVTATSGGGDVLATGVRGSLSVKTDGGQLAVNGLTGTLYADTGGGNMAARAVASPTATVYTGGGDAQVGFIGRQDTVTVISGGGQAQLWFTGPPRVVYVSSDGGPALLTVPGGPYAVTTDSGGGPQTVGIATAPRASRSISVATGGGPLQIEPPGRSGPVPPIPPQPPDPPGQQVLPGAYASPAG
jgi:hypothetical protein